MEPSCSSPVPLSRDAFRGASSFKRCSRQPVFLALLDINLVESGAQTLRQLLRVIIRPEMHEKEPRLLVEHVAMQCSHLDTVPKKFLEHRVHFLCDKHEIASNGGF